VESDAHALCQKGYGQYMDQMRLTKIFLLLIIMTVVIIYIDNGIKSYDMKFYLGKDNGYFKRVESIILFSTLFFFIVPRQFSLLQLVKGFITGIASVIISYFLIFALYRPDEGLIFHIFSSFACVITFILWEKRSLKVDNLKKSERRRL
jgi:hypothetical protein